MATRYVDVVDRGPVFVHVFVCVRTHSWLHWRKFMTLTDKSTRSLEEEVTHFVTMYRAIADTA
eukprot:5514632-Amphidinium_carterae.1